MLHGPENEPLPTQIKSTAARKSPAPGERTEPISEVKTLVPDLATRAGGWKELEGLDGTLDASGSSADNASRSDLEDAPTLLPSASPVEVVGATGQAGGDGGAGGLERYRDRFVMERCAGGRLERAVHPRLRRPVVLRILEAEAAADSRRREEFVALARLLASVDTKHVAVEVLEAEMEGEEPYIAFGVVEGEALDSPPAMAHRASGPGDWFYDNRTLARSLRDALAGLEALERSRLVHGRVGSDALVRSAGGGLIRIRGVEGAELAEEGHVEGFARDLAALAAAMAESWGGVRDSGENGLARALRSANAGLASRLCVALERCIGGRHGGKRWDAAQARRCVEQVARQRPRLTPLVDRLLTLIYDVFLCLWWVPIGWLISSWLERVGIGLELGYRYGLTQGDLTFGLALVLAAVSYVAQEVFLGWTLGRWARGFRLLDRSVSRPARLRLLARVALKFGLVAAFGVAIHGVLWVAAGVTEMLGTTPGWLARVPWLKGGGGRPLFYGEQPFEYLLIMVFGPLALYYASVLATRIRRPWPDVWTGVTWAWLEPVGEGSAGTRADARTDRAAAVVASKGETGVGSRLGPYRLEQELGRGGMGSVYAAQDEVLRRKVAVKVIITDAHTSAEALRRFEQEARLAAGVRHENVGRTFSAGEAGGKPFIAMELIEGETLQHRLDRAGAVPVAEAWDSIRQAARGLQAAQRLGIVHRDIKPSNLMVTPEGVVKVMDFGVSKLLEDAEEPAAGAGESADRPGADAAARTEMIHLTRTGALLGTPLYMSPEQANGKALDFRSDIYSLGLTLYHLVAGRAPFQASTAIDLLLKQCHESPAPLEMLTEEQSALLERMIAKRPEERFASYEELIAELEATAPRAPETASAASREGAVMIDAGLILGFQVLLGLAYFGLPLAWISAILPYLTQAFLLGFIVSTGLTGYTPGKWLMGVRVVRRDGGRVGLLRSLARNVTFNFSLFIPIFIMWLSLALRVPLVMPEWAPISLTLTTFGLWVISVWLMQRPGERRTIHDLVAGTKVLRVERPIGVRGARGRGDRNPRKKGGS
jgi:uncharacterized RDD family membrane protein YckC/predicted Ser/Thr protein kinase